MKTIEIKIENYDKETPELGERFKELGLKPFDSLHFQFKQIPTGVYHVELDTVFSNQYNTAEGFRVFEKCSCLSTPSMKKLQGYYISEGIDKIREYQKDLKVCGYCGKQYYKTEQTVCDKCLGREYLKENEIHLLKLVNVEESFNYNRKLTGKVYKDTLIKYKDAQGLGKINRKKALKSKNRKNVASLLPEAKTKSKELIEEAKTKTAAYTWLLDNGLNILNNVIYYTHTKRFCFGWLNPVDETTKSKLLDTLCEFPFDYDIK